MRTGTMTAGNSQPWNLCTDTAFARASYTSSVGYGTAHELWREGAIPVGGLTTESVYTRLLVGLALLERDEATAFMEEANAELAG